MEAADMDETDIINEELKTAIHKLKKTKETRWGIIKEKFFEKYENCSEEEESDVDGFEKFLAVKENIPPKVGTKKSDGAWYEQEFIAPELKDYHEEAERLRDEIEDKIKTLNLIVGNKSVINQEISKSGSTESADSIDNNSVDNIPVEISKSDSTNGAALIDTDRIKNSTANLPVEIQKSAPRSEAPLIGVDECKDSAVNLTPQIQSDSTTEPTLVETNKSPNLGLVMPPKKQVQKGNKKPLTRSQNNNRGKGASNSTKGRTKNKQKPQNSIDESLSEYDSSAETEVIRRNVQDQELEAAINKLHHIKMRRWALIQQKFYDKYDKNSSDNCGNGHRKYELMGQEADLVFTADDLVSYHEEANNLREFIEQKILTLKPYQAKLKSKKKAKQLAELQSKNTMEKMMSVARQFQDKCSLEDNQNVPKMKNKSQPSRASKEKLVTVKEITSPPQSLRAGSSSPSVTLCSLVKPGPSHSPKKSIIDDEKNQTDDSEITLPLLTGKKQKSLVKNSRLQKFQKRQSVSNAKTLSNTDCEEMAELDTESVEENLSTNGVLSFSAACNEGYSKRNLQNGDKTEEPHSGSSHSESDASEDNSSTTAISSSDVNIQSRNRFSKHEQPSQNAETNQHGRNVKKLLHFNKRKRGKEASLELFQDDTVSEDCDLPEVFSNCTIYSNEKLSSSSSSTINGFNGLAINDETSCDSLSTENVQGNGFNHSTAASLPIAKPKRICLKNQALPRKEKYQSPGRNRSASNPSPKKFQSLRVSPSIMNPGQNSLPRTESYHERVPQEIDCGSITVENSAVDEESYSSSPSFRTVSRFPNQMVHSDQVFLKSPNLQRKEKYQSPGRNRSASNPSPKNYQSLRVTPRKEQYECHPDSMVVNRSSNDRNKLDFIEKPNSAAHLPSPRKRQPLMPSPNHPALQKIKRLQMEREPTSSFSDPEMSESISSLDSVNTNLQRGSPTKKQKSERDLRVKRLLEEDKLSRANSNRHSPRLDASLQNPRIIKSVDVKFLSFQEEPNRPEVCNLHLSVNKRRRSTISHSFTRGGHTLQRTLSASSRLDLPIDDLVRPRK